MHLLFKAWKDYFQRNRIHFTHINFNGVAELSAAEKELVCASIQQFQRGESSEGLHLLKIAKAYDPDYHEAIQIFIKEEQKHAGVLARFMKQERIPLIGGHWTDSAFRKLRKLLTIENTITVLLTAEIVAAAYYRALHNATQSVTLQAICNQIISDEEMHINFQAYTLRNFYFKSSPVKRQAYRAYHSLLMLGTALLVWAYHSHIFKAGNYTFTAYMQFIAEEFTRARDMITGYNAIAIRQEESTTALSSSPAIF